uniref:Polyketide biosynthesis cytochrome P450 PksS n=1 Tax=Thermosporothrix sp. COM3 TaxID=2490863 RepID=A0A455SFZ9_9CHLR|nr:polyketide biosynthesis cytochrome P450 PksS [Thermosporothrix sp. COM3]
MKAYTLAEYASQEAKRHPHTFFAVHHQSVPLSCFTLPNGLNGWIVTGYQETERFLKDPRLTKDLSTIFTREQIRQYYPEVFLCLTKQMLNVDPPEHTRLRGIVAHAFIPRAVEQLRDRIQHITDMLLDALAEQKEVDFVSSFAFPLPIMVISEILGIPEALRQPLHALFQTPLATTADPDTTSEMHPDLEMTLLDYYKQLLAFKRAHPGGDLVSQLIHVEKQALSEQELMNTINLLIGAGYETTAHLIGTGMLALLQYPDQMQLLRMHPELIEQAIEELLRYVSPVSILTERWCREDMHYAGQQMQRGDQVFISLSAAHVDPRSYCHAERLDILRKEQKHLAFGKGTHYCLGASLARLEARIAFTTLLRRFPRIRLMADPETLPWCPYYLFRGVSWLPVRLSA